MEQWLFQFYDALPEGHAYYFWIWLIAFTESLLVIGLIIPGSVLIIFSGFLAANGKGDPLILMSLAMVGAFAGDFISYALGARFGPRLMQTPLILRYRQPINDAFNLFKQHSALTIFVGRFFGPLRPFVPFVAGCAGINSRFFVIADLISSVLWGLWYPGVGFVFGTSWQRVQVWSGRLGLLLATVVIVWISTVWLKRMIDRKIAAAQATDETRTGLKKPVKYDMD